MDLVNFSVSNYRSITRANRLPISRSTVLIGPNNEGKSNLLNALSTGMNLIETYARGEAGSLRLIRYRYRELYDWDQDYPVQLQETKPKGQSVFRLEFSLTDAEIAEFKSEIGSNLNGTLPIELRIGRQQTPSFKVVKKGPGGPALSKKSTPIAKFIGRRIEFNYIPAIRTSEATSEIVSKMVHKQLSRLEVEKEYQEAVEKIRNLQKPLLDELSSEVTETLKKFLPEVEAVNVDVSARSKFRTLSRYCEITINDGTPTLLERKGDGIKSLAAISLVYGSKSNIGARIMALEEPESHLHPAAIHRLRAILSDLEDKSQIVITTHNPLFVDRVNIGSNILVSDSAATPATSITEVRDLLGVRASDNLQHARVVLVVEGKTDRRILNKVLAANSELLRYKIGSNELAIETLSGASNLSYKLDQLQSALCLYHVFIDKDESGERSIDLAQDEGLLRARDVHMTICRGMRESELEDCIKWERYRKRIMDKFGVDINCKTFRSAKSKWSERLRSVFRENGRPFNKRTLMEVKREVCSAVEDCPEDAFNIKKAPVISSLITQLEEKIESVE